MVKIDDSSEFTLRTANVIRDEIPITTNYRFLRFSASVHFHLAVHSSPSRFNECKVKANKAIKKRPTAQFRLIETSNGYLLH